MFRGLSELVSLDLKGNELKFIEDTSFSALPELKHLDISSNKIESLAPNTFAGTLQKQSPSTARVLYIYGRYTVYKLKNRISVWLTLIKRLVRFQWFMAQTNAKQKGLTIL